MNRSLALLAVLLAVLVAGCGGGSSKSSQGGGSSTTTGNGSGIKIGLVTDVGGLNDRGFNHLAYVGVQEAAAKLGVSYHVNLSNSPSEYVPNLTQFARQSYDLITGVGFTEANAI